MLTEWKRLQNPAEVESVARKAREQTQRYKAGLLGTLELKRTRYIVLVAERDVKAPDDFIGADGIRYRHVVVPVKPAVASVPRA